MSTIVTHDRVIMNVKASFAEALQEANAIKSSHANIVELRVGLMGKLLGYLVVPSEHACCACGQHVSAPVVHATEDVNAVKASNG